MQIAVHSKDIAQSFSAAASSYERWANLQRATARRLADLLPQQGNVNSILDVGCGTGFLTQLLFERFSDIPILGIDVAPGMVEVCRERWAHVRSMSFHVADAERFDPKQSFDLITSSFCFQWFNARMQSVGRLAKMLNPGGMYAVAVPVAGSLIELTESYQSVCCEELPGLRYPSAEDYIDTLNEAGLKFLFAKEEIVQNIYQSGLEALRSFKGIGASFKHFRGYTPLSACKVQKVSRYYERHYAMADGNLPLTYRVLYFFARCVQ